MESIILKQVPLEASYDFFENQLIVALEGGSNYWIKCANIIHINNMPKPKGVSMSEWAWIVLDSRGHIEFETVDDEKVILTKQKFISGAILWADKHDVPVVYDNKRVIVDTGNLDANDADAILQYSVFGCLMYG